MRVENHGGLISTGKIPDLPTRGLWQSYQQSHLVANQEELGEANNEFGRQNVFVHNLKWFSVCLKIIITWGFTSSSQEGVLQFFIALKICRLGWV
jgi:hypothetical protein